MRAAALLVVGLVACGDERPAWQGRVIALSTFADAASARRAGCLSEGDDAGAGFAAHAAARGGLAPLIEARPAPWVLIVQAQPVQDQPEEQPKAYELRLLEGAEHQLGRLTISDREYARATEEGQPMSRFVGQLNEPDEYDGRAPRVRLPSAFGEAELDLHDASLSGRVTLDPAGLAAHVVMAAYYSGDVAKDAKLHEGVARSCAGADCDVASVCLSLLVEPMAELADPVP